MAQALNPDWLVRRLQSAFKSRIEYENDLYGPLNSLLLGIFPPSRGYLVKPQAVIRPHLPVVSTSVLPPGTGHHPDAVRQSARIAALPGPALGHSTKLSVDSIGSAGSYDSYGEPASLKKVRRGVPEEVWIPDFIVAKASDYTGANFDSIIVLLEVKSDDSARNVFIRQVEGYLDAIQTKEYVDGFVAYLTIGADTIVWRTEINGTDRRQVQADRTIRTGGRVFLERLQALA